MTIQQVRDFYENKEEHYYISTCFVNCGYHQKKGGYIQNAKNAGIDINFDGEKPSPNQKWHLIVSYIKIHLIDKMKKSPDDSFYVGRLLCPELLLWMAEAAGLDEDMIKGAAKKAREIIVEKGRKGRNKAGRLIKEDIETDLETKIMEYSERYKN